MSKPIIPNPTIWIVDSDRHSREETARCLQTAGYDVLADDSEKDFMARLHRGERPALLVIGYPTGDETDAEVTKHRLARGTAIPVLQIGGSALHQGDRRATSWVVQVPRPVEPQTLHAAIKRLQTIVRERTEAPGTRGDAEMENATVEDHADFLARASAILEQSLADVEMAKETVRRAHEVVAVIDETSRPALARRDAVLTMVARELHTPLSTISMAAVTMKHRVDAGEWPRDVERTAEVVLRNVRRMEGILRDLSYCTQIDANALCVRCKSESLVSLLRESIDSILSNAPGRSIVIVVDEHELDPEISCDRDIMLRVLARIFSNVLERTAEDKEIAVSISCSEQEVVVQIKDVDLEVSAVTATSLLDPDDPYDLSVGLYLARKMIEAHGGTVWVEYQAEHEIILSFALPLVRS